jgi:Lrp/AsnC family leucine-responsive transcriptional regulator
MPSGVGRFRLPDQGAHPRVAEYRKLLGDMLLNLPGAAQSKSYVVMEEIKETLILPTEPVP